MTKRCLQSVSLVVVLACSALWPQSAVAQAPVPAIPAAQRAGSITALLPVAKITRGTGRTRAVLEAKKGDQVAFNDLLQTEKGGRARITLTDQSILSLGSQAELRIIRHDARTQQTALQLGYGRVRAEVASVTRDGGRFELRTPTAVAGVIGTDFGSDSSLPGVTSFICISGIVQVSNSDEKIGGMVACPAGNTTTVSTGLPPTAPKPATQQQIQQLIQDTEPAIISSLSPASALLGTEVAAAASGSRLSGINSVSISGTGITVALDGTPTDTSAQLKVVVSENAAPGTRTITFTKANGQTAAAVFTVMAPPKTGEGAVDWVALKKAYADIMEQERESAITGANALGIGVQQSAGNTQQLIQIENGKLQPPLDPQPIDRDVETAIRPMLQGMAGAGAAINEETANAKKQLETLLDEAQRRTAAAQPAPSDEEKLKIAKGIFDNLNGQLLGGYSRIQDTLGGVAKLVNGNLLQTLAKWTENLKIEAERQKAVPIPKVDADERSYDLGLVASFDAARSTATPGNSIASFNWVLCDSGYRPQVVGVPLPPTDTRCRPLAGFASTSSDFKFPTCQLNPVDYIARVTVTDTNNKATAMDVRVRVLPPQYDPPGVRLRSLSDSYQQLQLNGFLGYFDESFSGLTELQENMRRTFDSLASMNINLRLSQASLGCNEATVRADWEQAYTFKEDQTCANVQPGTVCQRVVFKQQEQLTVRMVRIPGKNWYITEFQGDNGTVQGTPPGPIQRDLSLPDLQITALTPSALPSSGPAAGREAGVIGVAPGANGFAAVVTNVGTADLQTGVRVRFVARDGSGNELASDIRDLAGPIPVGGSATVVGQLDVPDLGPGTNARIFAGVNPGCVVAEQNCDGSNVTLLDIIIGVVDLRVTGFTPVGSIIGTGPGQVDVTVTNLGSRTSLATSGNLKLLIGTNPVGSASLPAIPPGANVTIPITFTVPNASGTQSAAVVIAPSTTGEFNPSNDAFIGSLNITAASVDLRATTLAFASGSTPPFLSGQTVNVTFNVQNAGNRASAATGNVLVCRLFNSTAGTQIFAPIALPSIAAGATSTGLAYSFIVPPNFAGADTLTCGASQDPFEASGLLTDNQTTLAMAVSPNVDLQLVNIPVPVGADQMGGPSTVNFGVKNFGLDVAPSGWDVVLKINNVQVGTFTSSLPLNALSTQPVTISYTNPQLAPAPADIANVPATLQVNANAAIVETNTANNSGGASLRMVDFTLNTIPAPTNPLFAVNGRNFAASVINVLPVSYPLPLVVNYLGHPSGLNAGVTSTNLVGVPVVTPGTFTVTASATVDGVTHSSTAPFNVVVLNEINITAGTAFPPLTAGGSPQPLMVNVTGGVYPVTVTLGPLPTGVTTSSSVAQILTGPGSATWLISASLAASTGPFVATVQGTDAGVPANAVPSGNVTALFAGNVNGQSNYIISSVAFASPHTNAIGADAVQVGETLQINFAVQNTGSLTQAGSVFVSFTSGCNSPLNQSVSAPAAGATVTGSIPIPISCAPATYAQTASIISSPPESNLSDNSFGPVPFDVFDFTLTNTAPLTPQNVLLTGSAAMGINLSETGPSAPLALPLVVTNGGKATTIPTTTSINPGASGILITAAAGTVAGDTETITATIARFGVIKSATQQVQFFTASVDNISAGQPGISSSNPVLLPIDGSGGFVDFKLTGTFAGSATYNAPVVTGFNINLGGSPPSVPNDTFTLQVDAISGAPTTVTAIPLVIDIPNTNPPQSVSTNLYVRAYGVPNIQTDIAVPQGILARGDYNANPLLAGESGDLQVQVNNTGVGPSSSGLLLTVRLNSGAVISTTPAIIPSIAAGGSYVATVHVRMPDVLSSGAATLDAFVSADPLEQSTFDNHSALPVEVSDWSLSVSGLGILGDELTILVPSPGSDITTVAISVNTGGSVLNPIELGSRGASTYITPVVPATITTTQSVTVAASTTPLTPDGEYAVQVIARIKDGAVVTAQRGTTIHIRVNSGSPVASVSLTANPPNASDFASSACSNPCVPVQIDGLLVETVSLTATRTGPGSTGTTDLIFSDVADVISRVSVTGSPLVQEVNAVPYATPVAVNFAAVDSGGNVNTGLDQQVIVSATAVSTAARGGPVLEPVGSQQTTLHFNVGDIYLNFGCIDLGPGAVKSLSFGFSTAGNFTKPISWQWISTGGSNVSISVPNGSSSFPYTNAAANFTNNETNPIHTAVFVFAITISNGNGSATKYIEVPFHLSTNFCLSGAGRGDSAAGRSDGQIRPTTYWKRGPAGSVSSPGRIVDPGAGAIALPDLQIKPVDVSMSPSIPKAGDTLDVRFKVTNAGDGLASDVPISLQVNGTVIATETYTLKPGASTLGAFQVELAAAGDATPERAAFVRPARLTVDSATGEVSGDTERRLTNRTGLAAQLVVDPRGTIKQKSTSNKMVALTKASLVPVDGNVSVAERVYLEMNTVCSGFRVSSGAVVDCDGGADLDIAIEDFKSSRFTLNASLGVADLGIVEPSQANATGARFNNNASLVLGHTYAVQMTGGKVGYVKFSASLTPRQLESEAKRRFGLNGVRILRKLGGDTGSTNAGDVAGRIKQDALMYFDMTFRP